MRQSITDAGISIVNVNGYWVLLRDNERIAGTSRYTNRNAALRAALRLIQKEASRATPSL